MTTENDPRNSIARFLAGCLAPLAIGGGFLAWQGESGFVGLGETSGIAAGAVVFLLTVVVPCGLLALPGRPGPVGAFARGLLLPLAILAVDGVVRTGEEPRDADAETSFVEEAILRVWTPVSSLSRTIEAPGGGGAAGAPGVEARPASADQTALKERVAELERERDGLRVTLEGVRDFGPPEIQKRVQEVQEELEAARRRQGELEVDLAASRAEVGRVEGKLRSAEEGLLAARRAEEEAVGKVIDLKDAVLLAKDDAAFEKKKLLARIAKLERSGTAARFERLRERSFVPVGVDLELTTETRSHGVTIQANVDATKVRSPAFVLTPKGEPVAVLNLGIPHEGLLGGTVVFRSPVRKPMVGDLVYARLR